MTKYLSAVVLLTVVQLSLTSEMFARPDWVDNPAQSDTSYKYVIGRAADMPNEAQAVSAATKDAIAICIRESFGIESQIQQDSYESLDTTKSTTRFIESSSRVRLVGLEQIKFYSEKDNNDRISVWVLYRIPKDELRKESQRLKETKKSSEPIEFSIHGNLKDANGGFLEIITQPPGAKIKLNSEVYGKSPLKIGQLESGLYTIVIDHPEFEIVEESVTILPGKVQRLEKTLLKATERLHIQTNPSNSFVSIDGTAIGISPIESILVEAGKPHLIQISRADAESYSQEITVQRGSPRTLKINLPLKPAYLSLETEPSSAVIEIENSTRMTPIAKWQLEPGHHVVRISKEGFKPEVIKLDLAGDETLTLPRIKLLSLTEEEHRILNYPILFDVNFAFGTGSLKASKYGFSLTAGIEKKFNRFMGLKGSLGYAGSLGKKLPKKDEFDLSSHGLEASASIPLYLLKSLSIAPEIGFAWSKVTSRSLDTSGSVVESLDTANQVFYGGSVQWTYFANDESRCGFNTGLLIRKYSDSGSLKGSIMLMGLLGGRLRF